MTITHAVNRLRDAVERCGRVKFANVVISYPDAVALLNALAEPPPTTEDQLPLSRVERSLYNALRASEAPVTRDRLRQVADTPSGRPLSPASLWVHICRLRAKLADARAGEIKTMAGIGYRYIPEEELHG